MSYILLQLITVIIKIQKLLDSFFIIYKHSCFCFLKLCEFVCSLCPIECECRFHQEPKSISDYSDLQIQMITNHMIHVPKNHVSALQEQKILLMMEPSLQSVHHIFILTMLPLHLFLSYYNLFSFFSVVTFSFWCCFDFLLLFSSYAMVYQHVLYPFI